MAKVSARYSRREEIEALLDKTREEENKPPVQKQKKTLTRTQRIWKGIFNGLYCVLVLALVVMLYMGIQAKSEGKVPSLFGYRLFTVKTGSMVPTLPIGCYILTKTPDDPAAIEEGTITTFYFKDGSVVTHRIIERKTLDDGSISYVTKGDNPQNSIDPEELTPDRVIGEFVFKLTLPTFWSTNDR